MSEDNTGIEDLDLTEEDLEEVVESPDDGADEDSPANRLMELGIDRERATELDEAAANELIPILEERQKSFSQKTSELNQKVKTLEKKANDYDLITGSEEFQKFVLSQGQGEATPTKDGPPDPDEASEEEIFEWYVKRATKDQQEEISELKDMVSQLLNLEGERELSRHRESFPDWEKYEDDIGKYMRKGLDPEEAYRLARANDTEMVSVDELRSRVEKRKSANTLKGGKSGSVPKKIDEKEAKRMSEEAHFDAAAKRALAMLKDRS